MSSSAHAGTSKQPVKMAAAKNAPSESKSATAKMHRRSRSGTFLPGCMIQWIYANTDVFQVVLHADFEERNAKKASRLARLADTWDCDAITSGQCGGATESREDSRRRISRTASSALNSPRRRRKLNSSNNIRLRLLHQVSATHCRHPRNITKSQCRKLAVLPTSHRSQDTSSRIYLRMSTSRCLLHRNQ